MLEVMASCLTYYPVTFQQQLGYPMRKKRFVPTPGVAAASDGLVGLGCGTGQQWLDVCAMVGHPEWMEERSYFLERTALAPTIDAWVAEHTVAEVTDLASAFRIPNAPIVDGANATAIDHFVQRGAFVENPRDGVRQPRPAVPVVVGRPSAAPSGAGARRAHRRSASRPPGAGSTPGTAWRQAPSVCTLPFEGLRVLDMTAFWAGPLVGHVLALLGAEVIHLESAKRPDGVRLVGGVPQTEPQYWERGPIFSALNTNKKSLTIDFADPRGVELVKQIAATCDVVVENYTPRVLDGAGLDYESLRADNPDLVMVRMPGFGLDGPWRDLAAFAFVIEDASGPHVAHRTSRSAAERAVRRRRPQRRAPRAGRPARRPPPPRPHRRGFPRRGGDGRRRAEHRRRAGDRALRVRRPAHPHRQPRPVRGAAEPVPGGRAAGGP